ncbi:MAG: hypothetical protein HYR91_00105 [Flavobacteriia bacterium]|nr:hypothetical protein [Flavobacteriia bacterium]
MAINKVIGSFADTSIYGIKKLYFLMFFGVPSLPIFKYSFGFENSKINLLAFCYIIFEVISTIILGNYIVKLGKKWSLKEYEKIPSDQIMFPFLFSVGYLTLIHFGVFYFIVTFLIRNTKILE